MMDWLGRVLNLPKDFLFEESKGKGGGTMMSSASDCIFSAVTAARYRALETLGAYDENGEVTEIHPGHPLQKLVCYTSSEAHTAIVKACNLKLVDVRVIRSNNRLKITGEMVEKAIVEDINKGLIPFITYDVRPMKLITDTTEYF